MADDIRVLVVDDSASVRAALIKGLSADPGIDVIGFARDGVEALSKVKALKPDVVTLDVEMPRMDGVHALEQIMADQPTPVVMVSSLTGGGAETTIRALELGAVDFVLKKAARGTSAVQGLVTELREKVRQAATANVTGGAREISRRSKAAAAARRRARKARPCEKRAVVIASSTGGPQALRRVIPALPGDLPVPVLVVQHLPAGFTARMAQSLDSVSPLRVEEARLGGEVSVGQVLIAPGGVHMRISSNGAIRLTLEEREVGVRPAANATMESAALTYGAGTLGVVLTGMGSDGTRGARLIKDAGGEIIAQDESTCVVYGMPKSVVEAGYADHVVPLPDIASAITDLCATARGREEAAV